MRQHFEGIAESQQVPGICRLVADFSKKALQIINRVHVLPHLVPCHGLETQNFHRI